MTSLEYVNDIDEMMGALRKAAEPTKARYADITADDISDMRDILFNENVEKSVTESYKRAIASATKDKANIEQFADKWSKYKLDGKEVSEAAAAVSRNAAVAIRKIQFDMTIMNQLSSLAVGQFNKMPVEYMRVLTHLAHIFRENDARSVDPWRMRN